MGAWEREAALRRPGGRGSRRAAQRRMPRLSSLTPPATLQRQWVEYATPSQATQSVEDPVPPREHGDEHVAGAATCGRAPGQHLGATGERPATLRACTGLLGAFLGRSPIEVSWVAQGQKNAVDGVSGRRIFRTHKHRNDRSLRERSGGDPAGSARGAPRRLVAKLRHAPSSPLLVLMLCDAWRRAASGRTRRRSSVGGRSARLLSFVTLERRSHRPDAGASGRDRGRVGACSTIRALGGCISRS